MPADDGRDERREQVRVAADPARHERRLARGVRRALRARRAVTPSAGSIGPAGRAAGRVRPQLRGRRQHRLPAAGDLEQDPRQRDRQEPVVQAEQEHAGGDRGLPLDRRRSTDRPAMYSSSGTPAPPGAIGMIVMTRDEGEDGDDRARPGSTSSGTPVKRSATTNDDASTGPARRAFTPSAASPRRWTTSPSSVAEAVDRAADVGHAPAVRGARGPSSATVPDDSTDPVGGPVRADDGEHDAGRHEEDHDADDRDDGHRPVARRPARPWPR